jgi:hypothetical protein
MVLLRDWRNVEECRVVLMCETQVIFRVVETSEGLTKKLYDLFEVSISVWMRHGWETNDLKYLQHARSVIWSGKTLKHKLAQHQIVYTRFLALQEP